MTTKEFAKILQDKLTSEYGVDLSVASHQQIYRALALICRQMMSENHKKFQSKAIGTGSKQVYYLCMEFLMGRSLKMSLFNLGLNDAVQKALAEADISLDSIYEEEPDAGLGNGGLGRLAACYLDGMATTSICGTGYSILYEYGIFKQKIVDGWQQERADNWLPGGQVWLKSHPDQAVEVRFDGEIHENWDHGFHYIQHTNYNSVMAIPSDMYVQGYDGKGVAKLRLWQAKAPDFDMSSFSLGNYNTAMSKNASAELISKVLYPNDNHVEGKILRLRQQYFLSAASIGDIVQNHLSTYGTLENLPDKVAIQLNDTHPTLAIPEMMRILLDECGFGWDKSFDICQKVFSYTNHTLMSEALETWPVDMLGKILPRHLQIIFEINDYFLKTLQEQYPNDTDLLGRASIIDESNGRRVRMAWLAVVVSHKVNGVSELHSNLMVQSLFADFAKIFPGRFTNVTNGVTPRRWLAVANPSLSAVLDEHLGRNWRTDLSLLNELQQHCDFPMVNHAVHQAKLENKKRLAEYIAQQLNVVVNPKALFDVQIKRIHEYKRQLMNVLHVITRYNRIKADPDAKWVPRVNIFGGKAASAYYMAKHIIHLINDVAKVINNDPQIGDKLKVVFIPNYSVSLAQLIIPAADLSEQISLAGTEASGTSNMKFALNGALTIGTLDGANVEMLDHVGADNIFIFGNTAEEVEELRRQGYKPREYYEKDEELHQVLTQIGSGVFSPEDPGRYRDLVDSLINFGDHYQVLADYRSYVDCQDKVDELYELQEEWTAKAMLNIANMGYFSSDRTIKEYADHIWHIDPVRL